jgi:hypothetical protein
MVLTDLGGLFECSPAPLRSYWMPLRELEFEKVFERVRAVPLVRGRLLLALAALIDC